MALGFYFLGLILMFIGLPQLISGNLIAGGIVMGLVVFFFIMGLILEIAYLKVNSVGNSAKGLAKMFESIATLDKGGIHK